MADTSKKSTKSSTEKKTTLKEASTKKTTAKKTSSAAKAAVKKTPVAKDTAKKDTKKADIKKAEPKVVVEEKKIIAKETTIENKKISLDSIIAFIKENIVALIITILVGVLIGMGVLALAGFRRIPQLKDGSEVIISMKGNNITADDLYKELKSSYGLTLLLDNIDKLILESQYPDNDETTSYINSQVDYLKTAYGDQFEEYIQYYGFENEEKVREYFSLNYKRNLALLDYAKDLVTDSDVQEYYDNEVFGNIEASHILITYEDEETKATALETANKIINELNNASDVATRFAELAKEYSEDTTNKDDGGSLGEFGVGEMEEAFEDAAKALEVGKYTTKPVETSYGYHIILKTNQKEKTDLSELRDSIVETLAENILVSDSSVQYKALEEMRNENEVSFKDAVLREKYKQYLESLYASSEDKSE